MLLRQCKLRTPTTTANAVSSTSGVRRGERCSVRPWGCFGRSGGLFRGNGSTGSTSGGCSTAARAGGGGGGRQGRPACKGGGMRASTGRQGSKGFTVPFMKCAPSRDSIRKDPSGPLILIRVSDDPGRRQRW